MMMMIVDLMENRGGNSRLYTVEQAGIILELIDHDRQLERKMKKKLTQKGKEKALATFHCVVSEESTILISTHFAYPKNHFGSVVNVGGRTILEFLDRSNDRYGF